MDFILVVVVFLLMVETNAQGWPLLGSCMPCQCSLIDNDQERIKHVSCVNLNLTKIPSNLPTDLVVLDFSNNKLESKNIQEIRRFSYLQSLSLVKNKIETLDNSPFSKSSMLTSIQFTGNNITRLTKSSFSGLRNLEELSGLRVETVDTRVFQNLPRLAKLELEYTSSQIRKAIFDDLSIHTLRLTIEKASDIPGNLLAFGRNNLKTLLITGPKLSSMPEDLLMGLNLLRHVSFNMPSLAELPERIFRKFMLSNLRRIELSSIKNLPQGLFKGLDNLITLRINKAEELPNRLFDSLINLQFLDLSQSFISQVPANWFAKLNNLIRLNISQTSLRRLEHESFTGLIQLKTLDISGNSLRLIPKDVFTPVQNTLENLDLSENILKNIETDALGGMLSLKLLDLSDNKMSSLQSDMFNDLIRLRVLNLQENMLSSLPEKIFHHQQRLNELNLASNLFRSFPHALLEVSGLLLNLDLSFNTIDVIDYCLTGMFPFLEVLSLTGNPLVCDCNILKVKNIRPSLRLEGKCAKPKELANQRIADVELTDNCHKINCTVSISATKVLQGYDVDTVAYSQYGMGSEYLFSTELYSMASQLVHDDDHYQHSLLDSGFFLEKTEFKAIVGGLGGIFIICAFGLGVYLKKRHDQKTRYAVSQLDRQNWVV